MPRRLPRQSLRFWLPWFQKRALAEAALVRGDVVTDGSAPVVKQGDLQLYSDVGAAVYHSPPPPPQLPPRAVVALL
jgi:hypothetical protein